MFTSLHFSPFIPINIAFKDQPKLIINPLVNTVQPKNTQKELVTYCNISNISFPLLISVFTHNKTYKRTRYSLLILRDLSLSRFTQGYKALLIPAFSPAQPTNHANAKIQKIPPVNVNKPIKNSPIIFLQ